MSTDLMEASTEVAEFVTTIAENLTEIAGAIIENITEDATTTTTTIMPNSTEKMSTAFMEASTEVAEFVTTIAENLTENAVTVIENITEKAVMMSTSTPLAVVENVTASFMDVVSGASIHVATQDTTTITMIANETTTDYVVTIDDLKESMNVFFLLINSFIIFFLQGGFAFLEAGSVRSKNTTNILIKNLLDILLACAAFWVFGYMIAFSEGNTFLGFDYK